MVDTGADRRHDETDNEEGSVASIASIFKIFSELEPSFDHHGEGYASTPDRHSDLNDPSELTYSDRSLVGMELKGLLTLRNSVIVALSTQK